jgi:transglutaminase-like putative cysteine protease
MDTRRLWQLHHLLEFDTKTTLLYFETTIRLDHSPENAPDFRIEDYAQLIPSATQTKSCQTSLPTFSVTIQKTRTSCTGWPSLLSLGTNRPTGELLMTLNEAVAQGFSYKRRSSRGTQTPGETIERQEGTCRDFALLMMEAARSLGFAARFVTGYIYVPDRDGPVRFGGEDLPMRGAKSTYPVRAGLNSTRPTASSATEI